MLNLSYQSKAAGDHYNSDKKTDRPYVQSEWYSCSQSKWRGSPCMGGKV